MSEDQLTSFGKEHHVHFPRTVLMSPLQCSTVWQNIASLSDSLDMLQNLFIFDM